MTTIADHGLIGDLRSAALVGVDGSVDWFCCPRFDSPSVFGAVLDADRGGRWTITPVDGADHRQFYAPDSNVLITRFLSRSGVVEVQDCMPVLASHDPHHRQRLVRRVSAVRGSMRLRVDVLPRFDYGRAAHKTGRTGDLLWFAGPDLTLALTASIPLSLDAAGDASAEVELSAGVTLTFVLDVLVADEQVEDLPRVDADALLAGTMVF